MKTYFLLHKITLYSYYCLKLYLCTKEVMNTSWSSSTQCHCCQWSQKLWRKGWGINIIQLIEDILKTEDGSDTCILMCDLSAAFNTIARDLQLSRLKLYGVKKDTHKTEHYEYLWINFIHIRIKVSVDFCMLWSSKLISLPKTLLVHGLIVSKLTYCLSYFANYP